MYSCLISPSASRAKYSARVKRGLVSASMTHPHKPHSELSIAKTNSNGKSWDSHCYRAESSFTPNRFRATYSHSGSVLIFESQNSFHCKDSKLFSLYLYALFASVANLIWGARNTATSTSFPRLTRPFGRQNAIFGGIITCGTSAYGASERRAQYLDGCAIAAARSAVRRGNYPRTPASTALHPRPRWSPRLSGHVSRYEGGLSRHRMSSEFTSPASLRCSACEALAIDARLLLTCFQSKTRGNYGGDSFISGRRPRHR